MSEEIDNVPTDNPAPITPPASDSALSNDPAPVVDWRAKMAGDDEKLKGYLSRFNSESDFAKSAFETKRNIDSGVYKKAIPFPADATDEIKNQWRKENGVPVAISEYKLPDGLVIGESDKPIIDNFLNIMHESNVPDGIPQKAIDWYFKSQEAQAAQAAEEDAQFAAQTQTMLREEWGAEYTANYKMAQAFAVEKFGSEVGNALLAAGPDAIKALAGISREINPLATIAPHSNNPAAAIADEKADLENKMRNLDSWKKDVKGQARYKEIIAYENRIAGRR